MTQKAAEILSSFYSNQLHTDYSGRGMYGKTTYAISCSQEDFLKSLANIIEDYTYSKEEKREVAFALRSLQTDSLGMDIIYY